MSDTDSLYEKLRTTLRRLERLRSISGLLGWDEQVNLPPGAAGLRAEQNAALAGLIRNEAASPELGRLLEALHGADLLPENKRVVQVATRDFEQANRLGEDFVRSKAELDSHSYHAWAKAREEGRYSIFAPFLARQLDKAREQASLMGRDADPYSYWIDQFDPGMDLQSVEEIFEPLGAELAPLAAKLAEAAASFVPPQMQGFARQGQETLLREVLASMGFDFDHGRLDTALHPFCEGGGQDTRLTTRYDADNPLDSLFSAMHECGHGLYEQGLPDSEAGTALGMAAGMAVHESQSRIWENQVGRGRAFWTRWEPRLRELFPQQMEAISSEDLYLAINHVKPGPVRLDADEVTYNLHIMLRFSLEKRLLEGSLSHAELPEAWNAQARRLLGIEPSCEREGCMQDVHWACGLFGYFPSYTLGNLFAAQLWEKAGLELPGLDAALAYGQCRPLLDWLRKNVHAYARRFDTRELCQHVCGAKLSHKAFISYISGRYFPLHHA